MPHPVDLRRRIPRVPLAALALAACTRTGTVRVVADSTTAPGGVEVLALPSSASIPSEPARAAADSLGARFAAVRRSLVARADSLAMADRRTAAYADAYARYAADADSAARLRAARDSARRTLPPARPLPDSILAHAARAPLVQGAAMLALREGEWWIAVVDEHGAPVHALVEVKVRTKVIAIVVLGPP